MKLEINAIISIMLVHQVASLLAVIIDVVVVSISSIFFACGRYCYHLCHYHP